MDKQMMDDCLQQEDDTTYLGKRAKHDQTTSTASEPSEVLPQVPPLLVATPLSRSWECIFPCCVPARHPTLLLHLIFLMRFHAGYFVHSQLGSRSRFECP